MLMPEVITKERFYEMVDLAKREYRPAQAFIVTPEMAYWFLENKRPNRKIVKGNLAEMTRLHSIDQFPDAEDCMCFNPDGYLLNGQHRNTMIYNIDKPLIVCLRFGIPDADFDQMDVGPSRKGTDMASIKGLNNEKLAASIARNVILYCQNRLQSNGHASNRELAAFMDANHAALEYSAFLAKCARQQSTPLGVAHFIFSEVSQEKADAFMRAFTTGANLAANSPVLTLKLRLPSHAPKVGSRERIAHCFAAFNAFFLEQPMSKLKKFKHGSVERFKVADAVLAAYQKPLTSAMSAD